MHVTMEPSTIEWMKVREYVKPRNVNWYTTAHSRASSSASPIDATMIVGENAVEPPPRNWARYSFAVFTSNASFR